MYSPDMVIQAFDATTSHSKDEWTSIARHVISKLEEFLGATVRFEGSLFEGSLEDYIDEGFRMDVVCIPKFSTNLGFLMKGIPASAARNDGLGLGAMLFLFCNRRRLVSNKGEAFIDLEYCCNDGEGRWKSLGWFRDEYGEYPEFDEA